MLVSTVSLSAPWLKCSLNPSRFVSSFRGPLYMAAEMANFTRNQILLQAGTAMLAQAGQHRSAVGAAALGLTQREEKEKDWGQPSGWPLFFVRALRGR